MSMCLAGVDPPDVSESTAGRVLAPKGETAIPGANVHIIMWIWQQNDELTCLLGMGVGFALRAICIATT